LASGRNFGDTCNISLTWQSPGRETERQKKVNYKSEHSYQFFLIFFASGRNFGGAGNTDLAIPRQGDGETHKKLIINLNTVIHFFLFFFSDLAVPQQVDGTTKKVNYKSEHSYLFFSIYFLSAAEISAAAPATFL
jgi:hypothetical protein